MYKSAQVGCSEPSQLAVQPFQATGAQIRKSYPTSQSSHTDMDLVDFGWCWIWYCCCSSLVCIYWRSPISSFSQLSSFSTVLGCFSRSKTRPLSWPQRASVGNIDAERRTDSRSINFVKETLKQTSSIWRPLSSEFGQTQRKNHHHQPHCCVGHATHRRSARCSDERSSSRRPEYFFRQPWRLSPKKMIAMIQMGRYRQTHWKQKIRKRNQWTMVRFGSHTARGGCKGNSAPITIFTQ